MLRSCFLVFRIEVDELENDQLTGHRTLLDELSNWNPLFSSLEGNLHSEAETMSEVECVCLFLFAFLETIFFC